MKARKVISVLLAVFMISTALTACSQTDKTSTDSGSATTVSGDSSESDMTPYGKYPETIELHTATVSSTAANFQPGDSRDDNPMTRYILDKLNVKTVTDWETEDSEYTNKLSLMLASDGLPDMFMIKSSDYLLYRQLIENDMLADLSEAYEKVCNEHLKSTIESYDSKNLAPYQEDGALYAVGGGQYGYEHNLLWVRQDWMEECGITEMPKTIDDIKNILTIFKEKNPGGQNVGMALNAKDIGGGYSIMGAADPIFGAFGAIPKTWIKNNDGEVVYGSVAPEMKEGLRVLSEWYAEGLIDPQFATRTADGATQAVFTGGQTGMYFAPWWFSYSMSEMPITNEKANPMPVNAPLDAAGKYNVPWSKPAGNVLAVRKGYENPEAVFKVLNCEFDMWLGLDQEGADLIQKTRDGNVSWTYLFPTGNVNFSYSTIVPDVGLLTKNLIENGKEEGVATATEQDKIMARAAKGYADTGSIEGNGWVEYYGRYLASNIVAAPEVNIIHPVFSYTTEAMADLKPNLDVLEQTTFLKIVTGELPLDAFDQFVVDWYAQGGEQMTKEVTAMVD